MPVNDIRIMFERKKNRSSKSSIEIDNQPNKIWRQSKMLGNVKVKPLVANIVSTKQAFETN